MLRKVAYIIGMNPIENQIVKSRYHNSIRMLAERKDEERAIWALFAVKVMQYKKHVGWEKPDKDILVSCGDYDIRSAYSNSLEITKKTGFLKREVIGNIHWSLDYMKWESPSRMNGLEWRDYVDDTDFAVKEINSQYYNGHPTLTYTMSDDPGIEMLWTRINNEVNEAWCKVESQISEKLKTLLPVLK